MTTLWRCDVCFDLIDPDDGDERTVLKVTLSDDTGKNESERLDLCAGCKPGSVDVHMDWLTSEMGAFE